MSINITDKNGDTVEILIENTNEAITTINNQLDVSVLANLKTTVKDTLVNAINELCDSKLDNNALEIANSFKVKGELEADTIKINIDDEGNSTISFKDTTSDSYIKLFWDNSLRDWRLSFPDGTVVSIATSKDLENLQNQIDNISSILNFNFNTNKNTLVLKYLPESILDQYIGPEGEVVINSDEFHEFRIQDGKTPGGAIVSGTFIMEWEPHITIKKNQCVLYGNGLYKTIETHTTNEVFDLSKFATIANYKKYTETLYIEEPTDIITLGKKIRSKSDLDINIGGLITQKSKFTIIDDQHVQFDSVIPHNTDIEITYYEASILSNSTLGINVFIAEEDDTTMIPLNEIIDNKTMIHEVNIENTVLLNSEWELAEGNTNIILKNPVSKGTRVQIRFWKGIVAAQNGITFTPYIVNDTLYWKNDGGYANPTPMSITTKNTKQTIPGPKTFEDISVKEMDVLDSSNHAASTSYVIKHEKLHRSNCLNKITSHINVELINGELNIGKSNIFFPTSESILLDHALTHSSNTNAKEFLFIDKDFNIYTCDENSLFISNEVPTGPLKMVWYDTDNNDIKYTIDSGVSWISGLSFPLCQFTSNDQKIISLNNIFNDICLLGNRIIILPGFEGLIANGWMFNGFPNTIETTNDIILIKEYELENGIYDIILNENEVSISNVHYDFETNYLYDLENNIVKGVVIGQINIVNGQVKELQKVRPFRPLGYNDRTWISTQTLPSNKYIDLELNGNGTEYKAPANGYFILNMNSTQANEYVHLETKEREGFCERKYSVGENNLITCKQHIMAGHTLYIEYTASGGVDKFRFFYDEGFN